jgi:hypothetical protein
MTVTIDPQAFQYVFFDADLIVFIATDLLDRLDMTNDVHIAVDETTPLARTRSEIAADGTITVRVESGAFEDMRKPRHQSASATTESLARTLIRARDRLSGSFDDAPVDAELTLAQVAAWEAYAVGRLERVGVPTNQQRWRYNFRNRHGFTDRCDAVFDTLWSADALGWTDLDGLSQSAHLTTV